MALSDDTHRLPAGADGRWYALDPVDVLAQLGVDHGPQDCLLRRPRRGLSVRPQRFRERCRRRRFAACSISTGATCSSFWLGPQLSVRDQHEPTAIALLVITLFNASIELAPGGQGQVP